MNKVKCLFGDVVNIREEWLSKLSEEIISLIVNRNDEQLKVITNKGSFDDIQKIEQKYEKKISKVQKRFEKWNEKNDSFSFKLKRLKSEKSLVYEIIEDTIKLIVA